MKIQLMDCDTEDQRHCLNLIFLDFLDRSIGQNDQIYDQLTRYLRKVNFQYFTIRNESNYEIVML